MQKQFLFHFTKHVAKIKPNQNVQNRLFHFIHFGIFNTMMVIFYGLKTMERLLKRGPRSVVISFDYNMVKF